jgi:hypothetical protein
MAVIVTDKSHGTGSCLAFPSVADILLAYETARNTRQSELLMATPPSLQYIVPGKVTSLPIKEYAWSPN